jgi:hypothetical protein
LISRFIPLPRPANLPGRTSALRIIFEIAGAYLPTFTSGFSGSLRVVLEVPGALHATNAAGASVAFRISVPPLAGSSWLFCCFVWFHLITSLFFND